VGVHDSDQDDMLARNIQTSLATKVQDVSSSFRKQQSSYLQSKLICKLNPPIRLISAHFFFIHVEMQGQENRKADILGLGSDLSNEAAELLLDEDAQVVV
jgi:syntaxin 16